MNSLLTSLSSRLALAANHFFRRVTTDADGLEEYLSTAQSLHQLEDMQRSWDRSQRCQRLHGVPL